MNWDQVEGNWRQVKGKVKERWGILTDSDLDEIAGRREQLLGKLQARYGYATERAERELRDFERFMQAYEEAES
ncbi:MAG: CsbD family protein [Planctomycetota bacterium]|nr:MAG: CsbD family protein [Planctomycetota bacterium]